MNGSRQAPRRLLLANSPRLLRGLLKQVIQKEPSLQIVGEASDAAHLPAIVSQTGAQLVVLPLTPQGQFPEGAEKLLQACPQVCILALAADGSRARLKGLGRAGHEIVERDIEGLSLAELVGMLRSLPGGWPADSRI
jgi:DNA-binding NarL/FixJ family response regulator